MSIAPHLRSRSRMRQGGEAEDEGHLVLVPVVGTMGTQHVVALRSSPHRSALPADLPKPCGEQIWCHTHHLLPEHTLVKFSHIPPQAVPLKKKLMVRFIDASWWVKISKRWFYKYLIHLKDWSQMANKKVSSPYLELTRTFQAIALFLAHSSVFTWRFITRSYVRFPYI